MRMWMLAIVALMAILQLMLKKKEKESLFFSLVCWNESPLLQWDGIASLFYICLFVETTGRTTMASNNTEALQSVQLDGLVNSEKCNMG